MITTFWFNILSYIIEAITNFFLFLTLNLHLPLDQFSNDIALFLHGVWYFNGVLPIANMLILIGSVLVFESVMVGIGIFEWIWSKLPFVNSG